MHNDEIIVKLFLMENERLGIVISKGCEKHYMFNFDWSVENLGESLMVKLWDKEKLMYFDTVHIIDDEDTLYLSTKYKEDILLQCA